MADKKTTTVESVSTAVSSREADMAEEIEAGALGGDDEGAEDGAAEATDAAAEGGEEADATIEADGADAGDKKPAADQKTDATKTQRQKTVPHGALEKERQRRKAVEDEFRQYQAAQQEREARLDERMRLLQAAITPPETNQIPDPEQDIFAYVKYLQGEVNKLRGDTDAQATERRQRQEHEARQAQIHAIYSADAQAFAQETPDFMNAYRYLLKSRGDELSALGYNPAEREQYLRSDEMAIVQRAIAGGRSPAETVYNLAKMRGYQGPATVQDQADAGAANGQNGRGTGAEQIKQLAKAKEASTSLSRGGGANGNTPTLESIDRMKDDEFKAFVAKLNSKDPSGADKFFRKLEGGR